MTATEPARDRTVVPVPATGPVVVGVDGSDDAARALDWALGVATERSASLSVVTVIEEPQPVGPWGVLSVVAEVDDQGIATARHQARHALAEALARRDRDTTDDLLVDVLVGPPAEVLVDATPLDGQLVVGCRGRGGFGRLLLGSVSDAAAHHARTPVTVVRGDRPAELAPVVVGVDGSPGAQRALLYAAQRARETARDLHVLLAWRPFEGPWPAHDPGIVPPLSEFEAQAAVRLAELCAPVGTDVKVVQRLVHAHASAALMAASESAAELVVGSRGHGGFAGLLLGSTSAQLVRHAACPVTVVHPRSDKGD